VVQLRAGEARAGRPLGLHPDNPHYFLFRGRPAVLVTSGEHYGAVLNRDFDYRPYLDELKARSFNLTRTFAGTYREVPGSFGITDNTLAPRPGRFLCPWARSSTPGAGDGGNKFDLEAWDPAYFDRLRDFVTEAGRRGIVVELVLFCAIYDDKLWAVNPMNTRNNVNGVGKGSRRDVYTVRDQGLTAAQEALVGKLVSELKDYDNVYYEVCNEPYFGNVTRGWTDRMVAAVRAAEKSLPAGHLIAQNIANGSARVDRPNPDVSVFNFHYAAPPTAVAENEGLRRPVAFDETGFRGQADRPYRTEGWDFLLAGGAVYSNLDYSFTCARPDGTARVTTHPGGGGPRLRRQLEVLKRFLDGLDLVRMRPANGLVKGVRVTRPTARARATVRVLAEPGKSYAVYLNGGRRAEVQLELPAGSYRVEWIDTGTGQVARGEHLRHKDGVGTLASPDYQEDIALRVVREE
jgi:hypothetical protein